MVNFENSDVPDINTGESLSEAPLLASTNLHYDKRLFIITSYVHENSKPEHVVYINCSDLEIFMYWTRNSMNNLLSYHGLVDARISASEKDLPVLTTEYWIGAHAKKVWK